MAVISRSGFLVVCLAALSALFIQNMHHDSMLEGVPSGKTRVLDLSYAINDKLVPWPGDEKVFEAKVNASIEKNGYFTRSFWMLEHYGTHLDAPAHFPPGKTTVDQIPVKQLFGPAVVIDVRPESGKDAQGKMHFPGFSPESARLLIERKVSGLGCDTLSIDHGASSDYAVHHLALGAGLYQLESLTDLGELPETGAFLIVAPIKLAGGSGGPLRVFALLP